MITLTFLLGAVVLFVVGALLLGDKSQHRRLDRARWKEVQKRRKVGKRCMGAAALSVIAGILVYHYSGNRVVYHVPVRPPGPSPALAVGATALTRATTPPVPEPRPAPIPLPLTDLAPVVTPMSTPPPTPTEAPADTGMSTPSLAPSSMPIQAPAPAPITGTSSEPSLVTPLLREAYDLMQQQKYPEALYKINAAIRLDPKNGKAFGLRGNLYASQHMWDKAEADFQFSLQCRPGNTLMEFNLAEVQFQQKEWDAARPGFATLQQDPLLGDVCLYKVFLCDLFGGHEDLADKELAVFNQAGVNASYHFSNAAWCLYHQKQDDAKGWLTSASRIYNPAKFKLYADSLKAYNYPQSPGAPQPSTAATP